jgi:hypothetical protein
VKPSLDPFTAAPATMQAMLDLERRAKNCSLEHRLSELVKTWASQINGWPIASICTRAALALTESRRIACICLTRVQNYRSTLTLPGYVAA